MDEDRVSVTGTTGPCGLCLQEIAQQPTESFETRYGSVPVLEKVGGKHGWHAEEKKAITQRLDIVRACAQPRLSG